MELFKLYKNVCHKKKKEIHHKSFMQTLNTTFFLSHPPHREAV